MKRAVSVSLGSSTRNKQVSVTLAGVEISIERVGTDGDVAAAQRLFTELDGKVDCLGVGGVDLALYLDRRRYPLRAAQCLVENVHQTPVVDGSGLKRTLERRVFELAAPQLGDRPVHFRHAFVTMGVDRPGLALAATEVADRVVYGDFMFDLGLPLPIRGMRAFRRVLRIMLPIVSYFPMSIIYYGSSGSAPEPKYEKYWAEADILMGDFLFMRKYMPEDLTGKVIVTNTTTSDNVDLLRERGVRWMITTTPRYEGRSFGTNMMEAMLTAYAGKGRVLESSELNELIDELQIRPTVIDL